MALALGLLGAAVPSATSPGGQQLKIEILSNRADLISGGDALVEVLLPRNADPDKIRVDVDGREVTDAFAVRDNGRFMGLVTGLKEGENVLTARGQGRGAQITITNHHIGGPIFSGPQVQPWFCDTEAVGLGPATDEQCNAPTRYEFVYKDAASGEFRSYDPHNPPPDERVESTTTDEGRTVPYIVRVETGTINRSIYDVAVLFDPARTWTAWSPQEAWNQKLSWVFGCDYAPGHRQGRARTCNVATEEVPGREFLDDAALSRGFMVADSSLTHLGNNLNTVVGAETMMMVKEHIAETYGPIRYTIGFGGSGGAIAQHMIANQYPGLLNGLRPFGSFPDLWSIATVNGFDCPLLNRYFDNISPHLWPVAAQRDAVYGYEADAGPVTVGQGSAFCHHPLGGFRPSVWNPSIGGKGGGAEEAVHPGPCVPEDQIYDAETNPTGVRCSAQDYISNIVGHREPQEWDAVEKAIDRGFANRFLDNVGIQYGLKALEEGVISPEQFVDLNEKIGGWDIDANWQPQRAKADPVGVRRMYRSGQIVEGHQLDKVAIIDYRGDWNNDVHSNRQAAFTRERIGEAQGHVDNRAEWLEPSLHYMPSKPSLSLEVMDTWLAGVEADTSDDPLPLKIVRNRPAEAADGCFEDGERADPQACENYSLDDDPRLVAGMTDARAILKCQVKPLDRNDYGVDFTDDQWARLHDAFPTGVCDWSKPGVGQQPSTPWLTFANGPSGRPLGDPPMSSPLVPGGNPGEGSTDTSEAPHTTPTRRSLPATGGGLALLGLLMALPVAMSRRLWV